MPVKYYKRQVDKKKTDDDKARWSYKQKMEACTTFMMTGSWVATAAATGIPIDTVKKWGATQWWKDMQDEIRTQSRIELQGNLKRVVDKSLNHLEDRLDNGDFVYNSKTGKITRRPIPARTLSTVVSNAIDKTVLLEKLQSAPVQNQDQIASRLAKIQDEFKRFAQAREIPALKQESTSYAVIEGMQQMQDGQTLDGVSAEVQKTNATVLVQDMSQPLEAKESPRETV